MNLPINKPSKDLSVKEPPSPDFTPKLYPDFSVVDNTLLFLNVPERKITEPVASILRLCTGEHELSEIQSQVPEAGSGFTFEMLEQLGYIVFPQRFSSTQETKAESKVLIVSPHMDDAFLSIGGTILSWRETKEIHIVDVFGFDPWIVLQNRLEMDKVQQNAWRRKEELFNASLCNCNIEFWDYTGALNREYPTWNAEIDWIQDEVLYTNIRHDILTKIENNKYSQVLFPLAVGGHTDHRIIREIALSLTSSLTDNCELLFYEDLPYATELDHWECWQQLANHEDELSMSSLYIDISTQVDRKTLLLQTYRSQLLFYESYSIRQYHGKNHMITGVQAIDAIHQQSLHSIADYNERMWVF